MTIREITDDADSQTQRRVTEADRIHSARCVERIRMYWAQRGYTVHVETDGAEIVSDLVNGLPRRK